MAARPLALMIIAFAASCSEAYRLPSPPAGIAAVRARATTLRMDVAALNDQVIVELVTEPATSVGGIMLPTNFDKEETEGAFQRKPLNCATVLSVGPGKLRKDGTVVPITGITVGQKVVLAAGSEGIKVYPDDFDSAVYCYPYRRESRSRRAKGPSLASRERTHALFSRPQVFGGRGGLIDWARPDATRSARAAQLDGRCFAGRSASGQYVCAVGRLVMCGVSPPLSRRDVR